MPLALVLECEIACCTAIAEVLGHIGYGSLRAHSVKAALALLAGMPRA